MLLPKAVNVPLAFQRQPFEVSSLSLFGHGLPHFSLRYKKCYQLKSFLHFFLTYLPRATSCCCSPCHATASLIDLGLQPSQPRLWDAWPHPQASSSLTVWSWSYPAASGFWPAHHWFSARTLLQTKYTRIVNMFINLPNIPSFKINLQLINWNSCST